MERIEVKEGDRYWNLVIIKEVEPCVNKAGVEERMVLCKCDCGNYETVHLKYLRNGQHKHCLDRSKHPIKRRTEFENLHGMRIYRIWRNIKNRCKNKNNHNYHCYGGRGISICDEWDKSFKSFYDWSISNGYNDTLTIDRINNDGNYEPSNCRWISQREQCNNRRGLIEIEINGAKMSLMLFSEIMDLSYPMMYRKMIKLMKANMIPKIKTIDNNVRWRAKEGELYFWLTHDVEILNSCEVFDEDDDVRYEIGNYFKTKEAAEKVAEQIREIFKNSKAE